MTIDSGYVHRLAAREVEAERHFSLHFGKVLRVVVRARSRGWAAINVDDVVQETLTRVLAAVQQGAVRDGARFGAFVVGVCSRVMLELGRSGTRESPAEDVDAARARSVSPEQAAASREALEMVTEVMARLGTRDREILELVLVLDTDKDEVCQRFGVNREHLRVLLHRAKERFAALYRQRHPTGGEGEGAL